ncbi:hypothetical protein BT96DRAFT_451776 [Gymnopus androsaceus JB14]|uniref:F-box domain-containing protein n=1 Tax=Gymnopus androsaceus JB14 TaxID=1447944 RepID=A0A6A4I3T4_9AGAR|nr:hypothetical protein BT96DRAFT_451776 [Gymnopus androsaceus JB14]
MVNMYEDDLNLLAHTAPKLKKLSATMSSPEDFEVEIPLFVQLEHLEVYSLLAHELQILMDSNHHLVSLKIEDTVERTLDDEPSPTPCHTIDTLTLFQTVTSHNQSVLSYLTLSSLKVIRLERSAFHEQEVPPRICQSDWRYFNQFMAFLSRSSCPLTTLSIESLALADSKLINLLTHIPTLVNLSINDSYVLQKHSPITGRFIKSLRATSQPPIVPRLHSLKLDVGGSTFKDRSVVNMVRSRWIPEKRTSEELEPQVECLREFTIKFRNRNWKEKRVVYQPLEEMERDGMRVVVLWQNEGRS